MRNVLLSVALLASVPVFAQVEREMTPAVIQQAIEHGGQPCYQMMTEGGVLLGCYSTPFSRVGGAAERARKRYEILTPATVEAEAVAPDLVIYAVHQERARVVAIVVALQGSSDMASVIRPTKTDPKRGGLFATFPLAALSEANEVRVVFDSEVCGGKTGRPECIVPFKLDKVR